MKLHLVLASVVVAAAPAFAKKGNSPAGERLPPKWGGLIQPGPAVEPGARPKLFSSEMAGADVEFLLSAVESGRTRVWLSKLAMEKAQANEVRAVGDALEPLQAREIEIVGKLARDKGLPLAGTTMPAEQKAMVDKLGSLTGAKLDKALFEQIIGASERAVERYQAASHSKDAEIKAKAEELLPVAKDMLSLANRISGRSQNTATKPMMRGGPGPVPRVEVPGADEAAPEARPAALPATKPAGPAATPVARPDGPKPVPTNTQPALR